MTVAASRRDMGIMDTDMGLDERWQKGVECGLDGSDEKAAC